MEGIPVPVGVETREAVEDVSDGDLNEDDGGGENDLENMVLHRRIIPVTSFSSDLQKNKKTLASISKYSSADVDTRILLLE